MDGSLWPPSTPTDWGHHTNEFLVNALAGTVGGVAGIYVGSPLDVIKTRLQTGLATSGGGIVSTLVSTVRQQGVTALFRGSLVSAAGQAPNNFITFGAYGVTLSLLKAWREGSAGTGAPSLPPIGDVYIAGTMSGLLQTFALTPCELIKVQQQTFQADNGGKGPPLRMLDAGRTILGHSGLRGLYRGWAATVWRDAGTYGVYFSVYELIRRQLGTFDAVKGDVDAPAWALLTAGGLAGALSWLIALPADVVKSIIQAAPASSAEDLRIRTVAAAVYARSGPAGFLRGLMPCVIRALPVNAVTFFVYESALRRLE
jgi:solute carrier family 25 carnitine/acylcarnitine transporter 20/29